MSRKLLSSSTRIGVVYVPQKCGSFRPHLTWMNGFLSFRPSMLEEKSSLRVRRLRFLSLDLDVKTVHLKNTRTHTLRAGWHNVKAMKKCETADLLSVPLSNRRSLPSANIGNLTRILNKANKRHSTHSGLQSSRDGCRRRRYARLAVWR